MKHKLPIRLTRDENVYQNDAGGYVAEFYYDDWQNGREKRVRIGTYGTMKEAVKAVLRSRVGQVQS